MYICIMKPIDKSESNKPVKVESPKENPMPQRPVEPPRDKLSNPGKDIHKRNDSGNDKHGR